MFWSFSNIILLINVLLWLITFIVYQKPRSHFGAGSFLLLFNLSIAIVGFHLFNHPLATGWFTQMNIIPLLYLYVLLLVVAYPIFKFEDEEKLSIQQPGRLALNLLYIITILASLSQLSTIFKDFTSGLLKMLIDSSAGRELYLETYSKADQAGDWKIENFAAIISGMLSNIAILLLFYNLTKEQKNKWIISGLLLSVFLQILSSIAAGARGGIINVLLTSLITYLLLRNLISDKINKIVTRVGIVIVMLISIPIMLITTSRFGDNDSFSPLFSIEYYYGQSFLNFNNHGLDAGGLRNGDRTAALFKQVIWSDTPRNFLERRAKYSTMKMDESVFYTYVGDFTLDYGPIITFLIFIAASVFFTIKTKVRNQNVLFHKLIMVFFVVCVCVQGTMTLFSFSDVGGNLNLIAFVLVYFWFKIDYSFQQLYLWRK